MSDKTTLIFVYNADSGLFNTVTDMAHKIFSPSTYDCQLCALTHGVFSVQQEWTEFMTSLDRPMVFLHRDELHTQFGIDDVALPAILSQRGSDISVLIRHDEINACDTLDALKQLIRDKLAQLS